MSLINEALKKAQNIQARTPAGAGAASPSATASSPASAPRLKTKAAQVVPPPFVPTATTATAAPVVARRPGGSSKAVLALGAGLFVVALGVLGFAMFVLFGRQSKPAEVAQTTTVATPAPTAVAPTAGSPENAQPGVESASGASTAGSETAATPESATPATTPATASVPAPAPEPAPPPKRVNHPDARVQDFVNKLQVSGIRSGERARVLMNDRVYAPGDLVNAELEVHLTSISAHELGFEDAEGNTYSLRF